jgi:Immunity protein 21
MMKWRPKWIESGGGPLLFAPRSATRIWHGTGPSVSDEITDYEKACAVSDEIGIIEVGTAQALVLGDEPDRSALIQFSPSRVFILRWRWARSEESLVSALDWGKIDQLPSSSEQTFRTLEDQYLLFDSASSGEEIGDALMAEMHAGICSFDTLDFRPTPETCALIHRLRIKD